MRPAAPLSTALISSRVRSYSASTDRANRTIVLPLAVGSLPRVERLKSARRNRLSTSPRIRETAGWLTDRNSAVRWEEYTRGHNGQFNGVVGPGNQAGGLANIFEKSLGSAMKGGTTPLQAVYEYAERIEQNGFVFMDSPGYDPVAVTGQIASGANLICFTTGRGSMFGSKPTPTIKLASNSTLFNKLKGDMDLNCGAILDGEVDVDQMGSASSRRSCATLRASRPGARPWAWATTSSCPGTWAS